MGVRRGSCRAASGRRSGHAQLGRGGRRRRLVQHGGRDCHHHQGSRPRHRDQGHPRRRAPEPGGGGQQGGRNGLGAAVSERSGLPGHGPVREAAHRAARARRRHEHELLSLLCRCRIAVQQHGRDLRAEEKDAHRHLPGRQLRHLGPGAGPRSLQDQHSRAGKGRVRVRPRQLCLPGQPVQGPRTSTPCSRSWPCRARP